MTVTMWVIGDKEHRRFVNGSKSTQVYGLQDDDGLVPFQFAAVYAVKKGAEMSMKNSNRSLRYFCERDNKPMVELEVIPVEVNLATI